METLISNNLMLRTDFSEKNLIDSSEKHKSYLVVTETGKHLKVSPASYFLLESFNKGTAPEEIAKIFGVSIEKVAESYQTLTAKIKELDRNENNRRRGFWFLWEAIPGRFVSRVAAPLSIMFHPAIVFCACLLIISGIFFNVQSGTFGRSFSALQNPQTFWLGYFLFFLSTVAHEFGHASASARYGAPPDGIGFTIYLIFPAFYSDVTSSWRLKSRQRAVVGLGGMYFQLICAAFYTVFGLAFDHDAFKIAALMIFGNCVLNLNPFFKFDGYWILSDLLGVINLSQQPKRIFNYLYNRLKGAEVDRLPWGGWISFFVIFYSVCSIFIISFFIFAYSTHFLTAIGGYPAVLFEFSSKLFDGKPVGWTEAHSFFLSSATLFIFVYFFWNFAVKNLLVKLKKLHGQKI